MSTRRSRILIALCGILGTILLGIYFSTGSAGLSDNATTAQVVQAASQYYNIWFLATWIQATGSLLSVVFFLGLVYLCGSLARLEGVLTILGAAVLLAVVLIEGVFTMDIAHAVGSGHPASAVTSFDVMSVFVHIYAMAPAPLILLSLGTVLCSSTLLPRAFGYGALALGIAYAVVGLVGLFTTPLLTVVVLSLQSLWVVAAAVTLLVRAATPSPGITGARS